ncbi:MAG TPA: amino acid adenylation domain-containing protein, partial [Longimicrobiaceae bacterium]|nr:amino acid adenylation domain-containing protein [Longimicrobiaceae bacterium]
GVENLAYLIYTSGSTGTPKGVMIPHAGAGAFLHWAQGVFSGCLSGTLASTSVCFDLSVFEIFVPLSVGGTVVLAENALHLPHLPGKESVALLNTVPSAAAELVRTGGIPASVRVVNLAGEALPRVLVERLYDAGVEEVYNLYGPSETTTYSTYVRVMRGDGRAPSIGRPIANTHVYVLDRAMQPVPVGVPGELFIGGAGVARGYFDRPALTAERFLPDPFSGEPGARLYRTGDRARWLAEGTLEFLGRIDQQVKIRGFRIEPGEIEAALRTHPQVREAVVLAREDAPGERRLVGYVVLQGPLPATELREHLRGHLPEYMVPGAFVLLDALPLTPNGKLDRRALPTPGRMEEETYVAPRTPLEEVLAGIWVDVLGLERVGVHESFFQLGGHSLLATRILYRVRNALHVELPVRALFEAPTVAELARHVESLLQAGVRPVLPPLVPLPRQEPLPLSFAQQRLWFLAQLQPESAAYNVPSALRLEGRLDAAALEATLREVVQRHEALRTSFAVRSGRPVQVIASEGRLSLPIVDLTGLEPERREAWLRTLAAAEAVRPFDLRRSPLLRALLIRLAGEDHALLLTHHHIA